MMTDAPAADQHAAPPQQYAQCMDEHVAYMVQSVLHAHGEFATPSHLAWLHRMYSRVLLRTLELDRRELDLQRREAAVTAADSHAADTFPRGAKKSRRGRNRDARAARPGGGADGAAAELEGIVEAPA